LTSVLRRRHGIEIFVQARAFEIEHAVMQRRLLLEAHPATHRRGRIGRVERLRWVDPRELDEVPVSGATRKILRGLEPE
jgi:hypothetical protein